MKKSTKGALMLRACVAAYILYLAVGLIQDYGSSQNQTITLIAIIVFVLGGGLFLFTAIRSLAKGDYEDNTESVEEEKSEILEENVIDSETNEE